MRHKEYTDLFALVNGAELGIERPAAFEIPWDRGPRPNQWTLDTGQLHRAATELRELAEREHRRG